MITAAAAAHAAAQREAAQRAAAALANAGGLRGSSGISLLPPGGGFGPPEVHAGGAEGPVLPPPAALFSRAPHLRHRAAGDPLEAVAPAMRWVDQTAQLQARLLAGSVASQPGWSGGLAGSGSGGSALALRGPGLDPAAASSAAAALAMARALQSNAGREVGSPGDGLAWGFGALSAASAAGSGGLQLLPAGAASARHGGTGGGVGNGFLTAPRIKLPVWAVVAAKKGLGEHDVSSALQYTYTLGQLHARQVHREAYTALMRSTAGGKRVPLTPSQVSAGSRRLLARVGRLTQRGFAPGVEEDEEEALSAAAAAASAAAATTPLLGTRPAASRHSQQQHGGVPRWDPREAAHGSAAPFRAAAAAASVLSLGIADGKRDMAEPRLVLPFDPSTVLATEPLWLLRPVGSKGGAAALPGGAGRGGAGAAGGGGAAGSGADGRYRHNPDKLIRRKHKPAPTTTGEHIDCSMGLTDDQQERISAGPTVLEFGTFNVHTSVRKGFTVVNDLPQSILVALNIDAAALPQLARSTPASQVVPAGGVAGFDVCFYSDAGVDLRELVRYTINGQHTGQFLVTATALPIAVSLSRRDLPLRFPEGSLARSVCDTLVLANAGTSDAQFSWQPIVPATSAIAASATAVSMLSRAGSRPGTAAAMQAAREAREAGATAVGGASSSRGGAVGSASAGGAAAAAASAALPLAVRSGGGRSANPLDSFTIEPASGTVPAGGAVTVTVTYTPLCGALSTLSFALQVVGGPPGDSATLTAVGEEQSGSIGAREGTLDFGSMGVGTPREMSLTLTNDSRAGAADAHGAWFVAQDMLPPGVSVVPDRGRLAPGESTEVLVRVQSKAPLQLRGIAAGAAGGAAAQPSHAVTFHTRGGPSFAVPVAASVIVPNVRLTDGSCSSSGGSGGDEDGPLAFGGVLLGSITRRRVCIVNRSPIFTEVCVELGECPQWFVAPPALLAGGERDDTSVGDESAIQAESAGGFSGDSERERVRPSRGLLISTASFGAGAAAAAGGSDTPAGDWSPVAPGPRSARGGTLAALARAAAAGGRGGAAAATATASRGRRGFGGAGDGGDDSASASRGGAGSDGGPGTDDDDDDDEDDEEEGDSGAGEGAAEGALGSAAGSGAGGAAEQDDLGLLEMLQPSGGGASSGAGMAAAGRHGLQLAGGTGGRAARASLAAAAAGGGALARAAAAAAASEAVPEDPRLRALPRRFKVRLQPDSTLPFDLIYRPTDRAAHNFLLPITVVGCAQVPELARRVVGHGVAPKLRAEPGTTIEFQNRVVVPDPSRRVPYTLLLTLRNTDEGGGEVRWRADTSNLQPSFGSLRQVFWLEPGSGVIPPGGVASVRVRFCPDGTRHFANTVPIFLVDAEGRDVGSTVLPTPRPSTAASAASGGSLHTALTACSAGEAGAAADAGAEAAETDAGGPVPAAGGGAVDAAGRGPGRAAPPPPSPLLRSSALPDRLSRPPSAVTSRAGSSGPTRPARGSAGSADSAGSCKSDAGPPVPPGAPAEAAEAAAPSSSSALVSAAAASTQQQLLRGRPATAGSAVSGLSAGGASASAVRGGVLQPYLELELRGVGISPSLSFDTREVSLPPVPLGAEARARFYITANGFDHLTLAHRIVVGSFAAAAGMAGGLPFASPRSASRGTLAGGGAAGDGALSPGGFRGGASRRMSQAFGAAAAVAAFASAGAGAPRGAPAAGEGTLVRVPSAFSAASGSSRHTMGAPASVRGGGDAGSATAGGDAGTAVGGAAADGGVGGGRRGSIAAAASAYQAPGTPSVSAAGAPFGQVGGGGRVSGSAEAVQAAVAAELPSIPLTVSYPCGNVLSLSRSRLPVALSFRSPAPLSFTVMLEFRDASGGAAFCIPVSGCADNCVLTVYPYLEAAALRGLAYSVAPPPQLAAAARQARQAQQSPQLTAGGGAPMQGAGVPPVVRLVGTGTPAPAPAPAAVADTDAAASAFGSGSGRRRSRSPSPASRRPSPGEERVSPSSRRRASPSNSGGASGRAGRGGRGGSPSRSAEPSSALPPFDAIPPPLSLPHLRNVLKRVYDGSAASGSVGGGGGAGYTGASGAAPGAGAGGGSGGSLGAASAAERRAQAAAVASALSYGSPSSLALPPPHAVWPVRGPATPTLAPQQASVLLRWLNAALFRSPVAAFPEDLAANHGKALLEALDGLLAAGAGGGGGSFSGSGAALGLRQLHGAGAGGGSFPGRFRGRLPASKRERAAVMYAQAQGLLGFLRGHGAMLPQVQPEALLCREDFCRVRKYQHRGAFGAPWGAPILQYLSPAERIRRRKFLSAAFPLLSLEAWTSVCLQVVRLYVLPRVSVAALLSASGAVLAGEGEHSLRYLALREVALSAAARALDDKNGAAAAAAGGGSGPGGSGASVAGGSSASVAGPSGGGVGEAAPGQDRERSRSGSHRAALEAALSALAAAAGAAAADGTPIPLRALAAQGGTGRQGNAAGGRRPSAASTAITAAGGGGGAPGSPLLRRHSSATSSGLSLGTGLLGSGGPGAGEGAAGSAAGSKGPDGGWGNNLALRLRGASRGFQLLAAAVFGTAGGGSGASMLAGLGLPAGRSGPGSSPVGGPDGDGGSDGADAEGDEEEEAAGREGLDAVARAAGSHIPLDLSQLLAERTAVQRLLGRLTAPDAGLLGSNVYTPAEALLLRWLTYHRNRGCAVAALPHARAAAGGAGAGGASGDGNSSSGGGAGRGRSAGTRSVSRQQQATMQQPVSPRGGGSKQAKRGRSAGAGGGDSDGSKGAGRVMAFVPRRLVSFDADLRDGTAFVFALLSHAPELGSPGRPLDFSGGGLHPYPRTHTHRRSNALALAAALRELQLEPPFTADDLCPSAVEEEGAPAAPLPSLVAGGDSSSGVSGSSSSGAAGRDSPPPSPPGSPGRGGNAATFVPSTGLLLAADSIAREPMAASGAAYAPLPTSRVLQPLLVSPAPLGADASLPEGLPRLPVPALASQEVVLAAPQALPQGQGQGRAGVSDSANASSGSGGAVVSSAASVSSVGGRSYVSTASASKAAATGSSKPAASIAAAAAPSTTSASPAPSAVALPVATLSAPVSARNGLLWSLWLFSALPGLVPRHIVDFEGGAGTRISRSITLTNPGPRPLLYSAVLEGSPDFTLTSAPTVRVEPGGVATVTVCCTPRFARPVHAKLSCRSRREGAQPPQLLSFALRSRVVRRQPAATREVTARTYSSAVADVEVRNTWGRDATFTIAVTPLPASAAPGDNLPAETVRRLRGEAPSQFVVPAAAAIAALQAPISMGSLPMAACPPPPLSAGQFAPLSPVKRVAATLLGRGAGDLSPAAAAAASAGGDAALRPQLEHLYQPFWSRYRTIFLRAGQAKKVPLQFAPLLAGTHRAALVLTDAGHEVGELCVELVGRATPPVPFAKLTDSIPLPPMLAPGGGGGAGGGSPARQQMQRTGGGAGAAAALFSSAASSGAGARIVMEEPSSSIATAAVAALEAPAAAGAQGASARNRGAGRLAPTSQSQLGASSSFGSPPRLAATTASAAAGGAGSGAGSGEGGGSKLLPVVHVTRLLAIPPLNPQLESARDALRDRLDRPQRPAATRVSDGQRVAECTERLRAMTLLRTFGIAGTRPGRVKGGSVYAGGGGGGGSGGSDAGGTSSGRGGAGLAERPTTAAMGVLSATAATIAAASQGAAAPGRPPRAPGLLGAGGGAFGLPPSSIGLDARTGAGSSSHSGSSTGGIERDKDRVAAAAAAAAASDAAWLDGAVRAMRQAAGTSSSAAGGVQAAGASSSASVTGGAGAAAASKPSGIPPDVAAELVRAVGSFYTVHIDSPFFEAPPVVFVPGPLFPLTGAQAVSAAAASSSSSTSAAEGPGSGAGAVAPGTPAAGRRGDALLSTLSAAGASFGDSVSNPGTPAAGAVRRAASTLSSALGQSAQQQQLASSGRSAGGGAGGSGKLASLPAAPPALGSAGASLLQSLTANLAAAVLAHPEAAVSLAAAALTPAALFSLINPALGAVPPSATPRTPQALAAQLAASTLGMPTSRATSHMAAELAHRLPELTTPASVAETLARGDEASAGLLGKLPITLVARQPGVYAARITLVCEGVDVRVYDCEMVLDAALAAPAPTLSFATAALRPVTQMLPVVNTTGGDWVLDASLAPAGAGGSGTAPGRSGGGGGGRGRGSPGRAPASTLGLTAGSWAGGLGSGGGTGGGGGDGPHFCCPSRLHVAPFETALLPLTFAPHAPGQDAALLSLRHNARAEAEAASRRGQGLKPGGGGADPSGGGDDEGADSSTPDLRFELQGTATDPLASDALYASCRARETVTLSVTVPNHSAAAPACYEVACSLPQEAGFAGPRSITVPPATSWAVPGRGGTGHGRSSSHHQHRSSGAPQTPHGKTGVRSGSPLSRAGSDGGDADSRAGDLESGPPSPGSPGSPGSASPHAGSGSPRDRFDLGTSATAGGEGGTWSASGPMVGHAVTPGAATYSFTLTPGASGELAGTLAFRDTATRAQHWYALQLVVSAARPVARVSLVTTARSVVSAELEIFNATDAPATFDVSCLGEGVMGDPFLVVPQQSVRTYEVLYAPLLPTTDAPPPPGGVAALAQRLGAGSSGKGAAAGSGGGDGEDGAAAAGRLPAGVSPVEGGVRFLSPTAGEATYTLDLVAFPAPAVQVPPVSAPLGGSIAVPITLDNPTPQEAVVYGSVSDPDHWHIDWEGAVLQALGGAEGGGGGKRERGRHGGSGRDEEGEGEALDVGGATVGAAIALAGGAAAAGASSLRSLSRAAAISPLCSRTIHLVFTPSALAPSPPCTVSLFSDSLGDWQLRLTGRGVPPAAQRSTVLTAPVGSTVAGAITFTNPFPCAVYAVPRMRLRQGGHSRGGAGLLLAPQHHTQGASSRGAGATGASASGGGGVMAGSAATAMRGLHGPGGEAAAAAGASASVGAPGASSLRLLVNDAMAEAAAALEDAPVVSLLRSAAVRVAPFASVQLPFTFAPTAIAEVAGSAVVEVWPETAEGGRECGFPPRIAAAHAPAYAAAAADTEGGDEEEDRVSIDHRSLASDGGEGRGDAAGGMPPLLTPPMPFSPMRAGQPHPSRQQPVSSGRVGYTKLTTTIESFARRLGTGRSPSPPHSPRQQQPAARPVAPAVPEGIPAAAGAAFAPLRWEFPLRCLAEATVPSQAIRLSCPARQTSISPLALPLAGLVIPPPEHSLARAATPRQPQRSAAGSASPAGEGADGPFAAAFAAAQQGSASASDGQESDSAGSGASLSGVGVSFTMACVPAAAVAAGGFVTATGSRLTGSQVASLLARSVKILPRRNRLYDPREQAELHLVLQPTKALARLPAELVLTSTRGGGVWRFPLSLTFPPAPEDGHVLIEAPLGSTGSGSVSVRNVVPTPARYAAYFTPDTPGEFRVTPTAGVLPAGPRNGDGSGSGGSVSGSGRESPTRSGGGVSAGGTEGAGSARSGGGASTLFTVVFTPREYGRACTGRLVVETDAYTWVFAVRGQLPTYVPPELREAPPQYRTTPSKQQLGTGNGATKHR
jgi:hypothetical protein